jgi:hypothetical protein
MGLDTSCSEWHVEVLVRQSTGIASFLDTNRSLPGRKLVWLVCLIIIPRPSVSGEVLTRCII